MTPMEYDLHTQADLVFAICALHNFICHRVNREEDTFYHSADALQELQLRLGETEKNGGQWEEVA